ncbi:zinc finger protein 705A-like [Diprion similis]|uniref:zinc finger protein 705A-like n=1 Tax=Diprion similis TaxID=362088 RepID=UPI001EF981A9|nr:zinc finger protein 705A-like [Diprion similis]XP_046751130.1 zinc finger protein 705A-like [Diprion similis]
MSSETMPSKTAASSADCYVLYESMPKINRRIVNRAENGSDCCKRNSYSSSRMACTFHRCTCANLKAEYPSYATEEIRLFQEMQSRLKRNYSPDVKFCNLLDGEKANEVKDSSEETKYCIDSMDCEIIWAQNSTSADSTVDQVANELDTNEDTNEVQEDEKKINNDFLDIQPPDLNAKLVVSNSVSVTSQNVDNIVSTLNNNLMESPYKKRSRKCKDRKKRKEKKHPFKCGACKKSLSSLSKLESHLSGHVKSSKVEAEIYKNSVLALQKLNHENHRTKVEERFICEFCKKACAGRWDLFYHSVSTHSNERPYHCKFCSNNYKKPYHLRRHLSKEHGRQLK